MFNRSSTTIPVKWHWRVLWSQTKLRWPFLVWLAACFAAISLYRASPYMGGMSLFRGVVDAEAVALAPVETARIAEIHVVEGQVVRRNDDMVTMDASLVAHGVTADLLDAQRIETAFGDTLQDLIQAVSQRQDAISSIEAELAACRQDWEREQGLLGALRREQERRETLYADGVIDGLTRSEFLPELEALERAVASYPPRIAMYEQQLADAQQYYRAIVEWLGLDVDAGPSLIDAVQRRLDAGKVRELVEQARREAVLLKDAYTIRAPQDGIVTQIRAKRGEVVSADVPILRLVAASPKRIIAYLEESQVAQLYEGRQLLVEGAYRRYTATAVVETVSAEILVDAIHITADGREVPFRAQRSTLRFVGPHPFIAGETVFLKPPPEGGLSLYDRVVQALGRLPRALGVGKR